MISAGLVNYIVNYETIQVSIAIMQFPSYLIYILWITKFFGIIGLWISKIPSTIKEWIYSGFVYLLSLAAIGHLAISDGNQWGSIVALALIAATYITEKIYKKHL
jgi:hypothetical protein